MRGSGLRRRCALRDASAEMPTTTSPRSARNRRSVSRPVLRYGTVQLAIQHAPYGTSGGCRKRLKLIGQAPLAVAILGKMLLSGADDAPANAFGDVWVLFQVPPFIDQHRERQPALKIAIVLEVLLCRRHRAAGDRLGDVLVFLEVPGLIHLDTRNHHAQDLNEVVVGDADSQLAPHR